MKKRVKRETLSMMTTNRTQLRARTSNKGGFLGDQLKSGTSRIPKHANEANALAQSVGGQLRALRRTADMTTLELARRANISNGMLSKVERGTTLPSFGTIASLARALNVPVARLFAGYDERRDCSVVRAGQGLRVDRRGSRHGYTYELLGHLLSGEMFVEPYMVRLTDDASEHPSFQHTGVEFMYVISGRMSFRYADRLVDVGAGDSLLFDANALHGPERILSRPVTYLSIVMNLRA